MAPAAAVEGPWRRAREGPGLHGRHQAGGPKHTAAGQPHITHPPVSWLPPHTTHNTCGAKKQGKYSAQQQKDA